MHDFIRGCRIHFYAKFLYGRNNGINGFFLNTELRAVSHFPVLKDLFSIPNLMNYFHILLIPAYLLVYFHADSADGYRIAAGILILSALTDMVDGKIARKFNMVTEWGKLLDPAADKLTQGAVA